MNQMMYKFINAEWVKENGFGYWAVNGVAVSEKTMFSEKVRPNELGIKMVSNVIWVKESTAHACEKMVENPQETMNKGSLRNLANIRRIEAEELRGYLGEFGIEVVRRVEE